MAAPPPAAVRQLEDAAVAALRACRGARCGWASPGAATWPPRSSTSPTRTADRFTYPFLLRACGGVAAPKLAAQAHAHVVRSGCEAHAIVQNSLIEMYTRCGGLPLARKVFDGMRDKDAASWNMLISAHARLFFISSHESNVTFSFTFLH
jgi:hypothetical protein